MIEKTQNKVVFNKMYLLNWYGFVDVTIPFSRGISFLTGQNECGKSTAIDALKYAFLGDTEFNKSSGTSGRNLRSYTRGLVNATEEDYMRPVKKYSSVFTHIALEIYDEGENKYYVVGVILETSSTNEVTSYRYVLEDRKMDPQMFKYTKDDEIYPYSPSMFREKHNIRLMATDEGLKTFSRLTGLNLGQKHKTDYARKMRNMTNYKPGGNIPNFIKKSFLEEKNVNLLDLKNAKRDIANLEKELDVVKEECDLLEDILSKFAEHQTVSDRLLRDDVIKYYKLIHETDVSNDELNKRIDKNLINIKNNNLDIPKKEKKLQQIQEKADQLSRALATSDINASRNAAKRELADVQSDISMLKNDLEDLNNLQTAVEDVFQYVPEIIQNELNSDILLSLKKNSFKKEAKEIEVNKLAELLDNMVQKQSEKIGALDVQIQSSDSIIVKLKQRIDELNRNINAFTKNSEQQRLIRNIQNEFKKRKIDADVRMAAQYVASVDKSWAAAIETFLNYHRFAVIVDPEYYDIANDVFDRGAYKHVELVRTKALVRANFKVEDDSVFHKLKVNDPVAKKYFEFWLGKIHAVDLPDVRNHNNAMSKEGGLSRNYSVTQLNISALKEYCLGMDTIEQNKRLAQNELDQENARKTELLEIRRSAFSLRSRCSEERKKFKSCNFDAEIDLKNNQIREKKLIKKIEEYTKQLKEDTYYRKIQLELDKANSEKNTLFTSIVNMDAEIKRMTEQNADLKKQIKEGEKTIQENKLELIQLERKNPILVQKVIDECEKRIEKNEELRQRTEETKKRDKREQNRLHTELIAMQAQYNGNKDQAGRLPVNEDKDTEKQYRKRKKEVTVNERDRITARLKKNKERAWKIFENDFCSQIYKNVEDAKRDANLINKELEELKFSTTYTFKMSARNDDSSYAKIYKYAKYLKQHGTGDRPHQLMLGTDYYSDEEVQAMKTDVDKIIDNLLLKDSNGTDIQLYSDYRNYIDPEIYIDNGSNKKAKLSDQISYNSGAATQIPYLLILAASLTLFYNSRLCSTRLVIVDEAFEKMADSNIDVMLNFFKKQSFQAIICAPNNKMGSIGEASDAVVGIGKDEYGRMNVVDVKFKEQG